MGRREAQRGPRIFLHWRLPQKPPSWQPDVPAPEGPARAFRSPCTRRGEVETDCGSWGWRELRRLCPDDPLELGTWLQTKAGCQLGSRRDGGVEGGDAGVGHSLSSMSWRPSTCALLCICNSPSELPLLMTYKRLKSKNGHFWGQDFGRAEPQVLTLLGSSSLCAPLQAACLLQSLRML